MAWASLRSPASVAVACLFACMPSTVAGDEDQASPIFAVRQPPDYRDWQMISVAHEAGALDDLRAVLGNAIAIKAYRDGTRPFPDGAIIARLAWKYTTSDDNNAVFGQVQSYVPGAATNVQFSVKDPKKYAGTGGWGYGQFEGGHPNRSEVLMKTCAPCHARAPKDNDLVFTRYAP